MLLHRGSARDYNYITTQRCRGLLIIIVLHGSFARDYSFILLHGGSGSSRW